MVPTSMPPRRFIRSKTHILTLRSAFINESTFVVPKVPTLYSVLSTGESATNPGVYGPGANAHFLEKGQVVEIILNSYDPGKHPFHLHGHNFQAVVRSKPEAGPYANNVTIPEKPMRRDTFQVHPNSNIVIRFKADNPDKSPPFPYRVLVGSG